MFDISSISSADLLILNFLSDRLELLSSVSLFDVKKAIFSAKKGKACGVNNIPSAVLPNDLAICFLSAHSV